MNDLLNKFNSLKEINTKYGLEQQSIRIDEFIADMDNDSLNVPIIGKFSSGKSAIINTLLGRRRKILRENIKPETAFPAEICYASDSNADTVLVTYSKQDNDGNRKTEMFDHIDDYLEKQTEISSSGNVYCARFYLNHDFLSTIPRLMLVDMPGFRSGYDAHDRAINDYVNNSMAYILTFPFDEMTLTDKIGNILKQLCTLDKPVYIMITKMDKRPEGELAEKKKHLSEKITNYLGEREIEWIYTSANDGRIDELKGLLINLQEESETLLYTRKYIPELSARAKETLTYLRKRLDIGVLSESEYTEKEEKLAKDLEELLRSNEELKDDFRKDTQECVRDIVNDMLEEIETKVDTYVTLAMKGKKATEELNDKINADVRIAVNKSVKERFENVVRKYIEDTEKDINATETFNENLNCFNEQDSWDGVIDIAKDGVVGFVVGEVLRSALLRFAFGFYIPFIGIPVGIIGGILNMIFSAIESHEQKKMKLREKFLNEILPKIEKSIYPNIESELMKYYKEICKIVECEIIQRKETIENALKDCRKEIQDEAEAAGKDEESIKRDIELIEGLCNAG